MVSSQINQQLDRSPFGGWEFAVPEQRRVSLLDCLIDFWGFLLSMKHNHTKILLQMKLEVNR